VGNGIKRLIPKRENIYIPFREYQFWTGIGGMVFGGFVGWGLSAKPYNFHEGILVTLAGVLVGFLFLFRGCQLLGHLIIRKGFVILSDHI
jgi:hypothetical protein